MTLYSPCNSPGQNTGVGKLFFSPGDPPNPEIESRSPALQVDSLPAESPGKPNVMMTFQGEEAVNTGIGHVMEARLGK